MNVTLEGSGALSPMDVNGVNTMADKTTMKAAAKKKTAKKSAKVAKKAPAKRVAAKPALLSGGNPQIAKAEGDAPVQAYIAAMPGWKSDVGRRLDALIVRTVPGVRKAVKWNSPFYGVEGQGWFLNFHTFTNYVKVAFFRGTSLRPVPPGESKHKEDATSTSARATRSTMRRWRRGSGRRPRCPAGCRSSMNVDARSRAVAFRSLRRNSGLAELCPRRGVDDDGPSIGQGPDRVRRVAWHDCGHARAGDLREAVDREFEFAFEHLVQLLLRMVMLMNRGAASEFRSARRSC